MTNQKCAWCESTEVTGICAITSQYFCAKHRNHVHTHLEIEKWAILSRTRISPLRN